MPTPIQASNANSSDSFARASDKAGATVRDISSGLATELKSLVSDMEEFIASSANLTGDQLEEAREKVRTRVAAAKRKFSTTSENALARARHSAEVANEYVHEQPWAVIGVGMTVGFLAGLLVARRN